MLGQCPGETSHPVLRLWSVWASFGSGTNDDGTSTLYPGNLAYLVYVVCLCAAAVLAAVWHDRAARTARLRGSSPPPSWWVCSASPRR